MNETNKHHAELKADQERMEAWIKDCWGEALPDGVEAVAWDWTRTQKYRDWMAPRAQWTDKNASG